MPSPRILKELTTGHYFLTFVVHDHIEIFTQDKYLIILRLVLNRLQSSGYVLTIAYVFMKTHVHFVVYSDDTIKFVREFKRLTATFIKKQLLADDIQLLDKFVDEYGNFSLWTNKNMPKYIYSHRFLEQKVNYIHYNPVKAGYVDNIEDWKWSSASRTG